MLIKKITDKETYDLVMRLSKEDNHEMSPATHVVCNDEGSIIGSISILPTAIVWMDTKKNNACSSVKMEQQLTTFFGMSGEKVMMVPCKKSSPYNEYLTKLGYIKVSDFDLFLKGI